MDIIKKYSKTDPLQKQNYVTVWNKNCPMRRACLTENVLDYARISCDGET